MVLSKIIRPFYLFFPYVFSNRFSFSLLFDASLVQAAYNNWWSMQSVLGVLRSTTF